MIGSLEIWESIKPTKDSENTRIYHIPSTFIENLSIRNLHKALGKTV
jgi:hypothetical protein